MKTLVHYKSKYSKIGFLFLLMVLLISCGARTSISSKSKAGAGEKLRVLKSFYKGNNSAKVQQIIESAEDFLGTPYRFGGKTKSGVDCSGLVFSVYSINNVALPRRSEDQSLKGKKIEIEDAKPGDLLFFSTSGSGNVSHVGIVKEIKNLGEVIFIHSSTSQGVIISSLNEKYWNKAFLFARRVL